MANNQDNHNETEGKANEPSEQKIIIVTGVTGKVKWFNVKRGYGFVCRNDNQEDVFIHQSAIVKSNPDHPRKSVGEGEEILFDIVKGAKGNEAANVSGANGECVKGSEYALRFSRGRGRGGYRGRGNRGMGGGRPRGGRSRGSSGGDGGGQREFYRGGPPRGRPFRGGRPYVVQYRNQYNNYDMPPPPPPTQMYYEYDYYRGPMRGRGGMRGGRMMRGGPSREMMMNFSPFVEPAGEFYERRPRGGRGRIRRRSRGGRGGRGGGRGLPRGGRRPGGEKDEGEEQSHENDVNNDQHD